MFKRIDHVELVPSDFERSIRFYCETFGFHVKARMPASALPLVEIAYLSLGDTVLELIRLGETPPGSEAWQVGFRGIALEVDDMAGALEALAGRGIEPVWGPKDLGTSVRAEIRDPDGLMIELRHWKQA